MSLSQLEIEHTYLARRQSGGPAVFNDLGCLNFAFFMYQNNYNVVNQINVIYQALRQLGLAVYLNTENDIMLNGSRIVESIYGMSGEGCMHAGTLYWDADKSRRGRLLNDKNRKLGLANITDFNPVINLSEISRRILQCLADRYGPVYQLSITDNFEELVESYHNLGFIYQSDRQYTLIINDQYECGHVQLYVDMYKNCIDRIDVYMDEGDPQFQTVLHRVFDGLIIDDVSFRRRLFEAENMYENDMTRIYVYIKKESYRI